MSLPVTEDTPPDMLAGSMDLKVVLPAGQTVKMSIQRGTPMMDLLVQVTTAHCLNPGDYSLQAMGDKGVLPFKPSTPIGALDTFTVKIVEKKLHGRGRAPQVPQSFLNTFRLQVHLPRSQLFVIRVTPDVTLSEIMTHICTEKNLNLDKYEFRNPGNLDEVLELDKTLGYYKLQELSMMSKGNRAVTGLMFSAEIMNVKSSKHRQNSVCDSSLSSGSFGSRSGSPVPAINVVAMPPQPPIRKKRRPAPKPPSFAENEKKDQTNGSVLISHSRESSDSSGYHEASVLSESPTHGGPAGRMENDSPPDTLPRRSKLPPSQSFTNLTSIQPAPRARLSSSVSNTSLNSNGHSRKKRAPPPPPTQTSKGDKAKSSTLPTSVTEERRNGSSFSTSETTFRPYNVDEPVDESDTKVQIPVDITSDLVNETKASKDEVLAPLVLDVDVRVAPKPKPKPRTVVPTPGATQPRSSEDLTERKSGDGFRRSGRLNRWNNFENLTEEETPSEGSGDVSNNEKFRGEDESKTTECKFNGSAGRSAGGGESEDVKSCLLVGSSADVHEKSTPAEAEDQGDHDSINWEYQLPPPPTDFRDTNSPSCTEFGTITITPEVLENLGEPKKESSERVSKKPEPPIQQSNSKLENKERIERSESQNHHFRQGSDKKVLQNKVAHEVMYELTNVLNENKKCKEKSLSVSNLYINDSNPKDLKRNALNYSKSFSTEPVSSLKNFQLTTYQPKGLDRKSSSNEIVYNEITSKNYKNLEKSSSMECIQTKSLESTKFSEKTEDAFRKPVAPVQKKLKVAKRSASSIGVNTSNTQKRNALETDEGSEAWEDDANISVLRQQFLEFLKEKKLMNNDLNMSSLDVIRNILPELNGGEKNVRNNSHSHVNVVVNQKKEANSQGNAQWEPKEKRNAEDKVKIIDVKVKSSLPAEKELVVRHETKVKNSPPVGDKVVVRHESKVKSSPPAEDEVVLRREVKAKSPPPEEDDVVLRRDAKREVKMEVQRESLMKSSPEKKQEGGVRYSYQGPPSINFGTWGERPKTTKIIIKDEDYVTREKVTEKKTEMVQNRNGEVGNVQKPKEAKKPAQIVIKKPGVLSHYEMFSALPRKKEISSLELVHMEDEERKRRTERSEPKEFNRVPVVCGVELKKVFKSPQSSKPTTGFSLAEPPIEPEIKPKHSVSVYVNGNQDAVEKERTTSSMPCYSFILPKRNSAVMPVVKGFRPLEDNATTTNHVNISNHSNHININISSKNEDGGTTANHRSSPSRRQQMNGAIPPPPPPNISLVKLKPVSSGPAKPKPISQDLRGQLLSEIQNFRGLRKLKKSPAY